MAENEKLMAEFMDPNPQKCRYCGIDKAKLRRLLEAGPATIGRDSPEIERPRRQAAGPTDQEESK